MTSLTVDTCQIEKHGFAGKHAIITVRQRKGQLVSIRSDAALHGTATPKELRVWSDCDAVQDYVTVYDG